VHPTNSVEELAREIAPIERQEELVFVDTGPLPKNWA